MEMVVVLRFSSCGDEFVVKVVVMGVDVGVVRVVMVMVSQ